MSPHTKVLLTMGCAALVFVPVVNGGITAFTIWNLLPVPVALLPLLVEVSAPELKAAIRGFGYTILAVTLTVHLVYILKMGSVFSLPPGARLAGLPFYSIAAGYAAGMLCTLAVAARRTRAARQSEGLPESERTP